MSIFLLSLLFLLAAPAQQTTTPNPADLCTIQGVVVKVGTGEPLSKATVEAWPVVNRTGRDESAGSFAETDDMGRFELKDLTPGRYFLSAEHNGFSPQQYGQRTPEGAGAILSLSRGQTVPNIIFQLIPSAVISGHVYYEDGEPVLDAVVSAMRFTYLNGQRRMVGVGTKQTNDLGEFRIFGLSPGKYIVQAAPRTKQVQNPASKQGYEPIYYPGVPDADHAAPVAVRAGDEVPSIDITLQPVPTVTVRGHVFAAGCGEPVGTVFLAAQNSSLSLASQSFDSGTYPSGVFEFRNVPSGSYYLYASMQGGRRPCFGRQALEVVDADIDGVGVAGSQGVQIRGRLRVEGQNNSNLGSFSVTLLPKSTNLLFSSRPSGIVNPDGSFLLTNIYDNDYDVYVGLPENYFLKSGRLDGVDVLNAGVTVDSKHSPGLLDILVSANGASVDGVISKDQQPFQGATVTLVPDPPHRGEERRFKSVTTDQNGHFALQGVSPGDYKVFAWEKIEPGAHTNSEFLQPFEIRGESVHITEGSRNSVQVDLIPAKDSNP
jgi:hypothetical protein